jgi:hypothetical protein
MSSRCLCARLEALLMDLPLFRVAPAGAKWLMFALVKELAKPANAGAIPFSDAGRVSLLVSVSVSEVETYLAILLETGLLLRDAGGALTCPALEGLLARTSRAAENGRKGGRPRRGETAEDAMKRRQGHLMLPVEGKPTKPTAESSRAALTDTDSTPSVSQDARELYALTERLAVLAGMDPARGGYNGAPIRGWLAKGATPELLAEVVERVAGRSRNPITSFQYFAKAVDEAMEAARPATPAETQSSPWADALDAHILAGGRPERFPGPAEWRAQQQGRAA